MQASQLMGGQKISLRKGVAEKGGGIAGVRRACDLVGFGEIAKEHRWHGSGPQMGKGKGQHGGGHTVNAARTGDDAKAVGVGGGQCQKALTCLYLQL